MVFFAFMKAVLCTSAFSLDAEFRKVVAEEASSSIVSPWMRFVKVPY